MMTVVESAKVYLACGNTDMLKSINGLAALVNDTFELDLFSHSLFVFCNRQRDRLKILYWDHNGFWLCYRRLEKGRFRWPKETQKTPLAINRREFQWLLDGLTLEQKQAHKPVTARKVI